MPLLDHLIQYGLYITVYKRLVTIIIYYNFDKWHFFIGTIIPDFEKSVIFFVDTGKGS